MDVLSRKDGNQGGGNSDDESPGPSTSPAIQIPTIQMPATSTNGHSTASSTSVASAASASAAAVAAAAAAVAAVEQQASTTAAALQASNAQRHQNLNIYQNLIFNQNYTRHLPQRTEPSLASKHLDFPASTSFAYDTSSLHPIAATEADLDLVPSSRAADQNIWTTALQQRPVSQPAPSGSSSSSNGLCSLISPSSVQVSTALNGHTVLDLGGGGGGGGPGAVPQYKLDPDARLANFTYFYPGKTQKFANFAENRGYCKFPNKVQWSALASLLFFFPYIP
uniref:Uncharacterized protein n=1 Tax=Caenorhabditis japonica TaxID=281687 RepID=A0A8R1HUJ7_CAEJA